MDTLRHSRFTRNLSISTLDNTSGVFDPCTFLQNGELHQSLHVRSKPSKISKGASLQIVSTKGRYASLLQATPFNNIIPWSNKGKSGHWSFHCTGQWQKSNGSEHHLLPHSHSWRSKRLSEKCVIKKEKSWRFCRLRRSSCRHCRSPDSRRFIWKVHPTLFLRQSQFQHGLGHNCEEKGCRAELEQAAETKVSRCRTHQRRGKTRAGSYHTSIIITSQTPRANQAEANQQPSRNGWYQRLLFLDKCEGRTEHN